MNRFNYQNAQTVNKQMILFKPLNLFSESTLTDALNQPQKLMLVFGCCNSILKAIFFVLLLFCCLIQLYS